MPHHIFTYGSLMFQQVWQRVVRGRYQFEKASVANYARYAIAGEIYPAMVSQNGKFVAGIVYFNVDERDTQALDAFESTDYRREKVLATLENGDMLEVETYIYQDKARMTAELWEPETFQLQHFLDSYCQTQQEK